MYLVTLERPDSAILSQKDYTEVSEAQEAKISSLIQKKTIPTSFKVGQKTILSDTILGFVSELPPKPRTAPVRGFSQFRDVVHQSAWYKRSKSQQEAKASH